MIDFRDALFDEIYQLMLIDNDIVVITNDMGAFGFDQLTKAFPGRTINLGIAEQNLISVSAGLAFAGKKVFAFGIASHVTFRCFEQIKLDMCVSNLPVVLIGMGPGLTYGNDGPTHHATEDVGALRCLPNLSIFNPCDVVAVSHSVKQAYSSGGPCYIRLDKEQNIPLWLEDDLATDYGFKILSEGVDTLVISTGVITYQVRAAIGNKNISHIDIMRLKPIEHNVLVPLLVSYKRIIVVDEHVKTGSLFSAIAELIVEYGVSVKLESVTLPDDRFLLGSATRKWAYQKFGFTTEALESLFLNGTSS